MEKNRHFHGPMMPKLCDPDIPRNVTLKPQPWWLRWRHWWW